MGQIITQVDAFSDRPFAGNPAAVCILAQARDESWMQAVAAEMNLSETAFLVKAGEGYDLRWFTPAVEVDLCGHATLASAHVLWEEGHVDPGREARFQTRSGLLSATLRDGWVEMDFPAILSSPAEAPPNLEAALGCRLGYVGKNRFDYLVEVESEEILRGLKPDFSLLAKLPVRGVSVTCRTTNGKFDFLSRFFAPGSGVDEDPVTGSAHCCLGPFWGERLGKKEMLAYQASSRGGAVRVRLNGDRALLGGQAVTVFRGELLEAE